jgi:hypothetical protein
MTDKVTLEQYERISRRLAHEAEGREQTWLEAAEVEGLEDPPRFMEAFAFASRGLLARNPTDPLILGIPMMAALMVGLRLGRIQAAEALGEEPETVDAEELEEEPEQYSWTQPMCRECWDKHALLKFDWAGMPEEGPPETCAWCGLDTRSGIYVRQDPAGVPFPRKEEP